MNLKIEKAINDQINFEFYSSYIYLAMAAHLNSVNLVGFAHWMEIQVQEELAHAMKLLNYLQSRDGRVELESIDKPQVSWESPLDAFEDALKHEKIVTSRINDLLDISLSEKDHATNAQLQWFINEQIEEEANVSAIVQQLKFAAGAPNILFMMDRELGQRVLVPIDNNTAK